MSENDEVSVASVFRKGTLAYSIDRLEVGESFSRTGRFDIDIMSKQKTEDFLIAQSSNISNALHRIKASYEGDTRQYRTERFRALNASCTAVFATVVVTRTE